MRGYPPNTLYGCWCWSIPNILRVQLLLVFSARCNICILRLCYDVSVRLSVTEVDWRIIANLGFKFRSKFTAHCAHIPQCTLLAVHAGALSSRCMPGRGEGSSHAMLGLLVLYISLFFPPPPFISPLMVAMKSSCDVCGSDPSGARGKSPANWCILSFSEVQIINPKSCWIFFTNFVWI